MHNIIVFEISIHAPPRGATSHGMPCLTSKSISIHAPPRGATSIRAGCTSSASAFQFTPLREGRLDDVMNALKPILFQFTPLREGRHVSDEGVRVHFYFNSRPSARGDSCTSISSVLFTISIHAPPRGATQLIGIGCGSSIFQFTPLREGRRPRSGSCHNRRYFNSRPSARGDVSFLFQLCILPISIHAPPRGATSHTPGASARPGIFQFTPLREGRPHPGARRFHFSISIHAPPRGATRYEVTDAASGEFQFTPLREGRPEMPDYWLRAPGYFNSRPSARGDRAYRRGWSISRYFNSRPSARGDRAAERRRLHPRISIHAPPRGATITKVNHTCR